MTKKVETKVTYQVGDNVVVKTTSWSGEVKMRVGIITNVRPAGKMNNCTYDIRTEDGSGLIMTSIDEKKSTQTIMSGLTAGYNNSGTSNNMYIHKKHGHTRANYSEGMKLRYDGQDGAGTLLVGQYEKYNDFKFPCQGPRSF
jgi:hypothetical protein